MRAAQCRVPCVVFGVCRALRVGCACATTVLWCRLVGAWMHMARQKGGVWLRAVASLGWPCTIHSDRCGGAGCLFATPAGPARPPLAATHPAGWLSVCGTPTTCLRVPCPSCRAGCETVPSQEEALRDRHVTSVLKDIQGAQCGGEEGGRAFGGEGEAADHEPIGAVKGAGCDAWGLRAGPHAARNHDNADTSHRRRGCVLLAGRQGCVAAPVCCRHRRGTAAPEHGQDRDTPAIPSIGKVGLHLARHTVLHPQCRPSALTLPRSHPHCPGAFPLPTLPPGTNTTRRATTPAPLAHRRASPGPELRPRPRGPLHHVVVGPMGPQRAGVLPRGGACGSSGRGRGPRPLEQQRIQRHASPRSPRRNAGTGRGDGCGPGGRGGRHDGRCRGGGAGRVAAVSGRQGPWGAGPAAASVQHGDAVPAALPRLLGQPQHVRVG